MEMEGGAVRHVVMVGLMGAGKSEVGRRVADRLGVPWRDSDAEIEAATGLTVRELRDRDGVDAMHALEARQLLDALGEPGPCVISAAASTVEVPACRVALTAPDIDVIWLRADPAVLARRFESADHHRPDFGASPELFLAEQAARRESLMAALDPIIVEVDAIGPDEAAARVIEGLG